MTAYMTSILLCKYCIFGDKNLLQFRRYRFFFAEDWFVSAHYVDISLAANFQNDLG